MSPVCNQEQSCGQNNESNLVFNDVTLFEFASPFESSRRIETNPKKDMAQLIPFAELTGGTETVRFTVIKEKTYMSIRDIIMLVCKKDAHTASNTWVNIEETKKEEVAQNLCHFKFPGQGQKMQPVITLKGALKLIECLPGENAKEY